MLIPRQAVPSLELPTLDHGAFSLATDNPERFSLVVFFRGLHCPLCVKYLKELGALLPELQERGVNVIAISSDDEHRAREMANKVNASNLRFGYALPLVTAKAWGLYISEGIGKTSIGIEEPKRFAEPGVFLVRPDRTLYYGAVQTMPFARPSFTDLMMAIDFSISKNYPARGEYTGPV
ncbi:peroxiredoxin-like family protein [Orrella daihaiensis]|uniref:AhpC/TSA family protein n=1 Tax=Orrella daihaiensis TaxID=2782176 RepID=A0ABY4ALV1_9BURK|nr:peroxiredoxin-like family protein [Orrella daihaiensis]UOD50047.1 AhpC/TSA family protein [Orrella daihaiensis]